MENSKSPIRVAEDEIVYNEFGGTDSFDKTIRCTYFIAVLFLEGQGIHAIDGVEHAIGPRQLHFLFPGQHHHWEVGPGTKAQRVVVGRKVFETFSSTEIFHLVRYNPHPVFKLEEELFRAVNYEMTAISALLLSPERESNWRAILSIRMDILALKISYEAENYIRETVLKNAKPLVQEFWLLINRDFISQKTVSWYADQLNFGITYLNLLCKKYLNVTAKQLIEQRVLLEAKQHLRFSGMSVKEIAYGLGFPDMPSFSSHFKKKSGFSPRAYQQ